MLKKQIYSINISICNRYVVITKDNNINLFRKKKV